MSAVLQAPPGYLELLAGKQRHAPMRGLREVPALHGRLFDYQRAAVEYLLRAGCGAAFLDTGLGKTAIQLEWARVVAEETGRPVLMFAPLAVGRQHVAEAARMDIEARVVREAADVRPGINITNYERLHKFTPDDLGAVVLDESSIIKAFTGATTRALMKFAAPLPWRLCATATPAPNDHMELGQHAQFLGVMESHEMLARWFIADQTQMGTYRLKRHGIESFWRWVASWARMASRPSDLGGCDEGFALPPLELERHIVRVDIGADTDGALFRMADTSATGIHREKRLTSADRAQRVADIVRADPGEAWVVWVETDYDADSVCAALPEAVEIRGSHKPEVKEQRLVDFSEGRLRVLVTKPSIAGFGLNWQHCARTAFAGLSFSYEQFYQAVRRFWRFGQRRAVQVHVVMAETEEAIWQVVARKRDDHETMKAQMVRAMRAAAEARSTRNAYAPALPASLPPELRRVG